MWVFMKRKRSEEKKWKRFQKCLNFFERAEQTCICFGETFFKRLQKYVAFEYEKEALYSFFNSV